MLEYTFPLIRKREDIAERVREMSGNKGKVSERCKLEKISGFVSFTLR